MNPFYEEVFQIVKQIPSGKVVSYSQISWKLGRLHGARMVGRAMRDCPDNLPAHRVLRADGRLVGSNAEQRKAQLLAEGVAVNTNGKVDMRRFCWKELDSL